MRNRTSPEVATQKAVRAQNAHTPTEDSVRATPPPRLFFKSLADSKYMSIRMARVHLA